MTVYQWKIQEANTTQDDNQEQPSHIGKINIMKYKWD